MAYNRLTNYLRTYRKRTGLSQAELTFLVGLRSKSEWSHYEKYRRQPSLHTALACEEVFGVPVSELFAGLNVTARRDATRRMRTLEASLRKQHAGQTFGWRILQKLQWLAMRLGDRLIPNLPAFS